MSTYTLFGKEVSFSKAADRYFYIIKAFESAVEGASNEFKSCYNNAGNISNVLDRYMKAVYSITKDWAIDPLYATLKKAEIFDVSEDTFEEACWDLESAEPYYDCIADKYNEIVGDLSDAKQYRALRKASRSRYGWRSSTDWGDITNAAITAGTLNAMSGIGHSIVNGIGNLGSSISAAASKKSLYNNEKTLDILDKGVRECVKNIYLLYMDFVNEYKENEGEEIWYDGSAYDSEKADTLLKNSGEVEGKEKELLYRAFSVCPYHYNVSASIFLKYEEERKNIFQIAKKYKNDLTPMLKWVIKFMYTEDAQKSEEKAQEAKAKIKDFMKEYGVTEDETLDQIEYDCLVRLCNPYKSSVPGENQSLLDAIVAYDATDDNKSIVIEEFRIWELAKKYDVELDDDEKEEIVATFIERAKNEKKLDKQTILEKVMFIMEGLELKDSEAQDDFEYDILDEFASQYDKLSVGEAENIVAQIKACYISDKVKRKYVYDKDIWELFEYYNIEIKNEEHIDVLYRQYVKLMSRHKDISDEDIKKSLYPIVVALVSAEGNSEVLYKPKSDIYLKKQIATSIKEHLVKAEIHGHQETKYTEIGLFFNSEHVREETLWVYDDPGFKCLWNELVVQLPEENDYAKDIILIYSHRIDDQKRMYTFLTHESIYGNKEGSSITCAPIHTYDYTNQYGHINFKNGKSLLDAFSVKGRSNPECDRIVDAISNTISVVNEQVALKETRVGQLKAYYELAKKVVLGDCSYNSLDNYSLNSAEKNINTTRTASACTTKFPNKEEKSQETKPVASAMESTSSVSPRTTNIVKRENETQVINNFASTHEKPNATVTSKLESCTGSIDKMKPLNQQLTALLTIYGNIVAVRTFLPGTAPFEKKIVKAIAAYAPISSSETPLLMEDFTVFGSAKEGFVWTNEKVYIKDTLEPKVSFPIQDVKAVRYTERSSSLYYVELVTTTKAHKISMRSTAAEAKKTAEFYNDVLKLVMEANKSNTKNINVTTSVENQSTGEKWLCQCGATNSGRFCPNCGNSKNTGISLWTCACGALNKGKFCPKCGSPQKEE